MRRSTLLLGPLLLLCTLVVGAQTPRLEYLGQLGGTAEAIDSDGSIVYLGQGPRVLAIDVSDPAAPVELGRSETLPNTVIDLVVAGEYVFVAADLYGLRVLSIADPTHPVEVGAADPKDAAVGVFVAGDLAYVADRYEGLSIYSVADVTAPERIGSIDTPGIAEDVFVAGDFAYVADQEGGLRVISVADPTDPIEVGACETFAYAVAIAVDGPYAYVADRSAGLQVVSIGDPTRPEPFGAVPFSQLTDVQVAGEHAYLSSGRGLGVVSLADRSAPLLLAEVRRSSGFEAISIQGDRLYAAADAGGLHAFSVADPESPTPVGELDTAFYGTDVVGSDRYAYLADSTVGLHIVSVADPSGPEEIGSFGLLEAAGLSVEGTTVYLCGPDALVIVDATDPQRPVEAGRVDLPGWAQAVAVDGAYAYVVCPYVGFHVVRIAEPADATIVAALPLDVYASDIVIAGDVAYIAADGIRVVSIADPLRPAALGRYESDELAKSLYVDGDRLYLGEGSFLRIFSIDDPANPALLGERRMGLGALIEVVGGYAIVGLGWLGVVVVDVSDPADLRTVTSLDTADRPGGVDVVDDLVYVADQNGGLFVMRFIDEEP